MGADQPRGLTRRGFLGAAAAAAVLAAAGRWRRAGEALGLVDREIPGALLGPDRVLGHKLRTGGFPAPSGAPERASVVIVGGGIAGLSAGWKLLRSGVSDFVVLELEDKAGGNSAWGENAVSPHPWGAHYLPVPGPRARAVREVLRDLGIITGERGGKPVYDEQAVCHAPEERLFIHGRWQDGLFPSAEAGPSDLAEHARFRAEMAAFRARRGADGRPAFSIPVEGSSRDPELLALDRVSMAAWMDSRGYRSPRLRWFVEYACKDDFGGALGEVSAWAGIHYYAARGVDEDDRFLVWPEGNGRLARLLAERLGSRVRTRALVHEVAPREGGVRVDWLDARTGAVRRLEAREAIVCLPRFTARRVVAPLREDRRPSAFAYAPWATANVTVEDPPPGLGASPAWDNVLYGSESLGYVDAGHQSLSLDRRRSVWTWYRPMTGEPDARRREAFQLGHEAIREMCLSDLERALPGLRRHVSHLDSWVWGHGMCLPRPGFLWGGEREAAAKPLGSIHFAHSDLSGVSIFEEANFRGVAAAEAVLARLGAPFKTSL